MLDTTALVRSIASPPALSHDTPIVSDNLPVTDDTPLSSEDIMTIDTNRRPALAQFFQDSEDLTDEEDDPLGDHIWEDDTID